MKSTKKTLFVCTLAALMVMSSFALLANAAATWTTQPISQLTGAGSSLALDSVGNPHIAYYEKTDAAVRTFALKYDSWTGTEWQSVSVTIIGPEPGILPSLKLDSNDFPHILYCDQTNWGHIALKCASWTGSYWSFTTVVTGGYSGNCIAIDSNDNLYVSYLERPTSTTSQLTFARLVGTSWEKAVVDPSLTVGMVLSSLVFDSNNQPHIAYSVANDGLKYASYNGANWDIVTIEPGIVGVKASLAFDSNDYPHISYTSREGTRYNLKYAFYDGYLWKTETVDSETISIISSDLALDSSGNPHIAYMNSTLLKYADLAQSSWTTTTVTNGSYAFFNSLSLDPLGYAHVIYYQNNPNPTAYYGSIMYTHETAQNPQFSKTSGGGKIVLTQSDIEPEMASFSFNVVYQQKSSLLHGKIQYEDKAVDVQSNSITSLSVSQDNTRATFAGTCTVNGVSGFSFKVYVQDNGEPGVNDFFMISLSNGYVASGTITNGNIQVLTKE